MPKVNSVRQSKRLAQRKSAAYKNAQRARRRPAQEWVPNVKGYHFEHGRITKN